MYCNVPTGNLPTKLSGQLGRSGQGAGTACRQENGFGEYLIPDLKVNPFSGYRAKGSVCHPKDKRGAHKSYKNSCVNLFMYFDSVSFPELSSELTDSPNFLGLQSYHRLEMEPNETKIHNYISFKMSMYSCIVHYK